MTDQKRRARAHGETWHRARKLYLAHPLIPVADLARVLGVTRQCFDDYTRDLKGERETRRGEALQRLKDAN
jgi:hypothetical protein